VSEFQTNWRKIEPFSIASRPLVRQRMDRRMLDCGLPCEPSGAGFLAKNEVAMSFRERCYDCYRPRDACFCAAIPAIDNRTEVLILQHRREHFHRFNTARIVHKGLRNSRLLADHIPNLARQLQTHPRAGLLYPGPDARPLEELPAEARPQQLVVIDGTWHHTKTLMRDIPALQSLPHYSLSPASPSRYRIRREPDEQFLSTVEATVSALRILEPETAGLEDLLRAFEQMVEWQLAHPGSSSLAPRFPARGPRTIVNIPLALQGDLTNIVVAYGEAAPGERGQKRSDPPPITWVARRLRDGAEFGCLLPPPQPISDAILTHLQLTRDDFARAIPLAEAQRRWAEFQRPGDIVAVTHAGADHLFAYIAGSEAPCLQLRSVNLRALDHGAPGAELFGASTNHSSAKPSFGRSTHRLEDAIARVSLLNAIVNGRERAKIAE
jgi:DTW domain-containing protein YfiP